MASYHHAPQLTTTSHLTLLIGPIVLLLPTEVHFGICLHGKKKKKKKTTPASPPFPFAFNSRAYSTGWSETYEGRVAALVTGTTQGVAQEVVYGEQRKGLQAFPWAVVTAV